jgi:hypothetical protein
VGREGAHFSSDWMSPRMALKIRTTESIPSSAPACSPLLARKCTCEKLQRSLVQAELQHVPEQCTCEQLPKH